MRKPKADQIRRIVVRTPNWVGDAVMSIPALRELRRLFPEAEITIVSPAGTADIFLEADFVDEVLHSNRSSLRSAVVEASSWRRKKFDLALLFQNAFAAALIPVLARIPHRIGYATDRRGALLTNALPVPNWKNERHESFYYLNIVAELERLVFGRPATNIEPRFELHVSESRKKAARSLLSENGVSVERPLVVMSPGSINSRAKRWPAERYAALSDQLIRWGSDVVLVGSTGELGVAEKVLSAVATAPANLTGRTSVAEVVAIISLADVLVTNDTGPAHLGAALGTPTIVIFGPTNPLTTYPLSSSAEIIRQPPDCAPCMLRDCPIDHRCMTAISPETVFQRAIEMLERRAAHIFG